MSWTDDTEALCATCGTCRYASGLSDFVEKGTDADFECRRYPPQVVVDGDRFCSEYPVVSEYGWCGEHRGKVEG